MIQKRLSQFALPAVEFSLCPHFLKHNLLAVIFNLGHFYKDKMKKF